MGLLSRHLFRSFRRVIFDDLGVAQMPQVVAAFFVLLSPALVLAQSGTSTISGIVRDPAGASVPDAKVRVVNVDSGVQLETVSNQDGLYRVGALLPGNYRLEIEAVGFDRLTRGPITLAVSQT